MLRKSKDGSMRRWGGRFNESMTHEESWQQNFELLKVYIEEHHHLPDKKKVENRGLLSWAKYQRKRIKAGTLDEEKTRLFLELMESRSKEHCGGKRKRHNPIAVGKDK